MKTRLTTSEKFAQSRSFIYLALIAFLFQVVATGIGHFYQLEKFISPKASFEVCTSTGAIVVIAQDDNYPGAPPQKLADNFCLLLANSLALLTPNSTTLFLSHKAVKLVIASNTSILHSPLDLRHAPPRAPPLFFI